MHAPQIIWIIVVAASLGINLAHHGKPKTGKENALYTILATAIHVSLLWWGGFFKAS